MSADRKFTLELKQNNTGKTLQIAITQQGKAFVPEYVFKTDKKDYYIGNDGGYVIINYTSYKTTESGGKEPIKPTARFSGYCDTCVNHPTVVVSDPDSNGKGTIKAQIVKNFSYYEEEVATVHIRQQRDTYSEPINVFIHVAIRPDDGIFKADPTTLSYSSDGGTKTSTITSTSKGKTIGWSVMDKSSVPDWVTVSGESTGTLSVTTKAYK
jgi:hypothetical protein